MSCVLTESLSDEIHRLMLRCANTEPASIPRKRQRKFSRLEREVLQCGDDIQHLQRFVNAQAIAFRKILKKYRVRAPMQQYGGDRYTKGPMTNARRTEMD